MSRWQPGRSAHSRAPLAYGVLVRMDWVPVSAALWVTGALAVCLGIFLLPDTDGSSDTLRLVAEHDGRWLAVAVILFLASVCLTTGLPSVLTLFQGRGRTLGLVAAIVLEFGFIGTASYAMLMVFFRSLVKSDALHAGALDDVTADLGLQVFLWSWIVGFYLGELLLAIALLRARATPSWVPAVLIAHVASMAVSGVLPEDVGRLTLLLTVAAFAGIAMQATSPKPLRRRELA